jgi:hypothetical protein
VRWRHPRSSCSPGSAAASTSAAVSSSARIFRAGAGG